MKIPILFAFCIFICSLACYVGYAQGPFHSPIPSSLADAPQTILEVRIEGNLQISNGDIVKIIKTQLVRSFIP